MKKTAPRATTGEPQSTILPLKLQPGDRIAFVGNVLLERMQLFGYFEAMVHQRFPEHRLTVRNLAWPADEITLQPRPENFADMEQHLTHEQADVVFMAFGFNESFAGDAGLEKFRQQLTEFISKMKSKQFNGKTTPRLVLIAPIANENIASVPAADMNNARLENISQSCRESP